MTAPAPSAAEQAVIARFGIFEEEERVERHRDEAMLVLGYTTLSYAALRDPAYGAHPDQVLVDRIAAALADAERRGEQRVAQRMADVADNLDHYGGEVGGGAGVGLRVAADRIRAALDPQTGGDR